MRAVVALCAVLGAACAASGFDAPQPEAPGVVTEIEILDDGFVRFEGRRRAVEWFLLEMRRRARAAGGEESRLPRVVIRFADGVAFEPARMHELTTELQKAGVRRVEIGGAGG